METTLEDGLTKLFGKRRPAVTAAPQPEPSSDSDDASPTATPTATQQALLKSALDAYDQSQQALQNGDWQAYGAAQTRLGKLLEQLSQTEE